MTETINGPPITSDVPDNAVPLKKMPTPKEQEDGTSPDAVIKESQRDAVNETDDVAHLTGLPLVAVFSVLCLAVFLTALDNTIIATAIPRITDEFHALDSVGWYGSAYLVTTCMFGLLFGKLYTLFPIKLVFLAVIIIFEAGSAICGAAPTSDIFIGGRAVAGLGAAGIFQGALVTVAYTVPVKSRPLYNGMLGSIYGIASIIGPPLGGALTSKASWRWWEASFYINLPIGGVVILTLVAFLRLPRLLQPERSTWAETLRRLDPWGTVTFLPGIVCLLLALQWGGTTYTWSNGRIMALFILSGVLLIAFIVIQVRRQEYAMVPPRILRVRNVLFGSLFNLFLSAAFFDIVYYLPIWFQAIKEVSAVQSGIRCLPLVLAMVIFSLLAGAGVTVLKGNYVPFFFVSSILSAIGAALMTTFTVTTPEPRWIGYEFLFGAGAGLGIQLPIIAAQAVLPADDIPVGTAVITFCQTFGGAIFISVSQTLFTNQLRRGILNTVPRVQPSVVQHLGATDLATVFDPQELPQVQKVYNAALVSTWYISIALSVLTLIGAVGIRRKRE